MRAVVRRWGNSLAVRIPMPAADAVGIEEGMEVEVLVHAGRLLVAPVGVSAASMVRREGAADVHRVAGGDRPRPAAQEMW